MLIYAAVAAVSVAVTALSLRACWQPGSLACTGVYPQLVAGFGARSPDAPDQSASPAWELDREHPISGSSGVLAADSHPCRCVDGIWNALSSKVLASQGLACLTAVRQALREGFSSCSSSACLQTLGEAVRGELSKP